MLIAILVFDLAVSLVDFWLEGESREFFGGLPTGEYVLHIVLAMLFGALVTSVFYEAPHWAGEPTALMDAPADVPTWLRGLLAIMAVLVFYSGVMDAHAAWRLSRSGPDDGQQAEQTH